MERTIFTSTAPRFTWVDVVDPSREELVALAAKYDLHPTSVADCLDPEHLPKYEPIAGTTFMILRAWDEAAPADAVTVQAATRKVAIFCSQEFLLTVHRKEQPYLSAVLDRYREGRVIHPGGTLYGVGGTPHAPRMLIDLFNAAVATYEKPLEAAETQADDFEGTLFDDAEIGGMLRGIYLVKRRLLLIKRMLWHMRSVIQRMVPAEEEGQPLLQDLRENADSLYGYTDELLEQVDGLRNTHLALASHRTNEVVRVLTLFSVFFLPLTFIVGVYGMNFRVMPELQWRYGYPLVWGVMIVTVLALYLWFRRRGWLRR